MNWIPVVLIVSLFSFPTGSQGLDKGKLSAAINLEGSTVINATAQPTMGPVTEIPSVAPTSISINYTVPLNPKLVIHFDPPPHHFEPTVLGVFARANDPNALVYYDTSGPACLGPTFKSPYLTYDSPFIVVDTLFKGSRNRTLCMVAVSYEPLTSIPYRSEQYNITYYVEGAARPGSFGFLIPGVQSGGYFVKFVLENVASARATTTSQEFADFYSTNGIGTYEGQVRPMKLINIDPDLTGFEGGFPTNTSTDKYHGYLIPYHNGRAFSGKLVRVDLKAMDSNATCLQNYRKEYLINGTLTVEGVATADDACVFIVDLATIHPLAKGFRRGFVNYPYGYLAAGEFSVLVRINVEDFGVATTKIFDAARLNPTYGGYSGGFADGTWACFNPFKTFTGPAGGLRSSLPVDAHRLTPYYYSVMLCVNETMWTAPASEINSIALRSQAFELDFSILDNNLRGFSDALRAGRYAYLCPLSSADHVYTSNLIRIQLGSVDIGTTALAVFANGGSVRDIVDVLDLSISNPKLKGYTGLFTSGNYLFLVPYRNAYEPQNGQRGHGLLTRLDMNYFSPANVDLADLTVATRQQVPSFQDLNLRGYISGFASGKYGLLIPFYNGNFFGKVARFQVLDKPLNSSIQELDMTLDRTIYNTYRGYRGGFVSIWQGVQF